ncbi:phosphoenolpyruvate synthase [Sediminibacillus dalangtanensis]|uniref:Phosphoenolpyruvate synthase n=1 Tax=Sediminibacillus dalangtanensis TaxID=2729421 RepID=A0ABX7VP64_9BACI|nr:phosphoenolpyruvate synthase [Sediminibacillus dalangtanensis]QTM98401.1 phosphoenolpyruvate synthase [Sediminibacillus dalangtanensis]
MAEKRYIRWFKEIRKGDIPLVGGKGANLGELTNGGIKVPPGFCVTAEAYSDFVKERNLDKQILEEVKQLDMENNAQLQSASALIRELILQTDILKAIEEEIREAYATFQSNLQVDDLFVAVRSSATAEDLPEASFAGQQDTYLEIKGISEVIRHVKKCWASLWTARAIYYREKQHFDHFDVSLCAVVQKMVNSKKAGVLFTSNPVTENHNQMMINASWGLGESVVSGMVSPDEYIVDKKNNRVLEKHIATKNFLVVKNEKAVGTSKVAVKEFLGEDLVTQQCLTATEISRLSADALRIEKMYHSPQDIEWAIDCDTNELYILQARPITTLKKEETVVKEQVEIKRVALLRGLAASPGTGSGKVRKIKDITEISKVEEGDILVTIMTNPDMMPAMKKAAAVVTDEGGRTCHAAIVSREFGIPCIVGSNNATEVLKEGMEVTVDATRGVVYQGILEEPAEKNRERNQTPSVIDQMNLHQLAPITGTKVYMNLGEPDLIGKYKDLPFDGIGLMRTEFIFTHLVGAHPMYLLRNGEEKQFIDKMAEGITKVAQDVYPKPVVVRLSDFRSNEFRGLKGGEEVEPIEANPMIGWRGVSRYISPEYEEGFRLECRAIKKVREDYGLINVWTMLPFVRTTWEVKRVKEIMAEEGLIQDQQFKIWIMAEVPSVIFEAEEFAKMVDGFSIGSNDLTQLVLGSDRDSGILNTMGYFDERNPAVKKAIKMLIQGAHKHNKSVSICGQGPSLYPEFTEFLIQEGIDSVSVNPDTVAGTRRLVASVEQRMIMNKIREL